MLDRFASKRFRVGSPGFIATKVALDEGVFGPIHVLGFFAYMTLVEGGTWQVSMLSLQLPCKHRMQNPCLHCEGSCECAVLPCRM
jgi:hypothetical protein